MSDYVYGLLDDFLDEFNHFALIINKCVLVWNPSRVAMTTEIDSVDVPCISELIYDEFSIYPPTSQSMEENHWRAVLLTLSIIQLNGRAGELFFQIFFHQHVMGTIIRSRIFESRG